ncbi:MULTISPECIES: transglutaminase family protein [unclassified Caulobacter]|uniref:transglutaminase family protein n=1 Tax=unclassified Caulobacter TaxID=2648921 RepID=UPI000785C6D8|nr:MULTISPECIES: transglutaminase family protein [unclassified Caulobacter]AZS20947.1 transglutaminase family protein [Caulobacter sp. FWC26]
MGRLRILHETHYDYDHPVGFGPQRLMIRPRDSHALRIVQASLRLFPQGATRWSYDANGNCVCIFQPSEGANAMRVVSELVIDRYPAPLALQRAEDPHTLTPIVYSREDRATLEPFIAPVTDDPDAELLRWLRNLPACRDEPALAFLLRVNELIHQQFDYVTRQEEGVQSPVETLRKQSGACRDLAWLMVEGLRRLGYAALFATGYIHSPGAQIRGAGATHAWCEVFLPDLGWLEFDPTNGLAESPDLIRVAATRTPAQALPVSGAIIGAPGASRLHVSVDVQLLDETGQAAVLK